jgi:hypothetical protein
MIIGQNISQCSWLALHIVAIALLTVGSAHAGNNSPATFGPLFDHFVDNCETFGQAIVTGSAGGAPAN